MNELSLFTGAGGGLLGTHLLGWNPIGYVEYDDYCQRIIAARIQDGILPDAPIFSDVRAFISEGYADAYSGLVDVLSAGFPCQPFSVAGRQQGADDERNMWPQTIDVIRLVRPRYALLENVPGLLAHPYARRIYGDLAESGYDCRWRRLSAAEAGAPHRRDRWWCVAYSNEAELRNAEGTGPRGELSTEPGNYISDGREGQRNWRDLAGSAANDPRRSATRGSDAPNAPDTDNPTAARQREHGGQIYAKSTPARPDSGSGEGWWAIEPDVGRVAHGVANRVDRLRALGNGQVPEVVRTAWNLLNE